MAEIQGKTLRDVQVGESATVRRLSGEGALKRHIMDMGITKGVGVYVRKVAPLGDPIEVTVRGYELSLRKSEAECILVDCACTPAQQPAHRPSMAARVRRFLPERVTVT